MLGDRQELDVREAHLVRRSRPAWGRARDRSASGCLPRARASRSRDGPRRSRWARSRAVGLLATAIQSCVAPRVSRRSQDLRRGAGRDARRRSRRGRPCRPSIAVDAGGDRSTCRACPCRRRDEASPRRPTWPPSVMGSAVASQSLKSPMTETGDARRVPRRRNCPAVAVWSTCAPELFVGPVVTFPRRGDAGRIRSDDIVRVPQKTRSLHIIIEILFSFDFATDPEDLRRA